MVFATPFWGPHPDLSIADLLALENLYPCLSGFSTNPQGMAFFKNGLAFPSLWSLWETRLPDLAWVAPNGAPRSGEHHSGEACP
jgi:hypothetical protein